MHSNWYLCIQQTVDVLTVVTVLTFSTVCIIIIIMIMHTAVQLYTEYLVRYDRISASVRTLNSYYLVYYCICVWEGVAGMWMSQVVSSCDSYYSCCSVSVYSSILFINKPGKQKFKEKKSQSRPLSFPALIRMSQSSSRAIPVMTPDAWLTRSF